MVWFAILTVLTCALALGLTPDPHSVQQLHTTSTGYRLAVLVLLVPYIIIWYAAFYAFAKLKEYARATKGYADGDAFHKIMIGVGLLAFTLVIPTAIGLVLNNISQHHHGFTPASVIISNYVSILMGVVTFAYIGAGTRLLTSIDKKRPGLTGLRLFTLFFITLSVSFTYLVMQYDSRHHNIYHLNRPLLIFTFIIPYLFGWFMGLLSAYEFALYGKYAKGILYRRALRQLAQGVTITIVGSVAIQFLDNTVIAEEAGESLGSLLLLDFLLVFIVLVGLVLMALGTKKLKKIEEV
jgi:hypothetical protein